MSLRDGSKFKALATVQSSMALRDGSKFNVARDGSKFKVQGAKFFLYSAT
jgi:hypothetical protein